MTHGRRPVLAAPRRPPADRSPHPAALRYTSPHARGPPGSHRRARTPRRPDSEGAVRDRPPRDQRSAAGRQRSVARPRRDRRRSDGGLRVRDRARGTAPTSTASQVTERAARRTATASGSAAAAAPRWSSSSPTSEPVPDKSSDDDRHRRPAADCRAARRPARPRDRAACWTTCCRSCWIRRSTSAAPSAVHHAGARHRRARVQDGARPRPHHAVGQQLRDEPEDSRRSVPNGRAAPGGGPARRRAGERAHGHGGARHPQRPVRAAAARAVSRQGGSASARSAGSACCISTAAKRAC